VRVVGAVAYMVAKLFGKSEGNRPLWKLRHRWYCNVTDLEEIIWEGM
jgi:hypothetical protein